MAIKIYSDLTKKFYDTKEDAVKAEVEVTKAKADRETRAKEVEKALKEYREAEKKANKLLSEFVKDYGSFKTTIKDEDTGVTNSFWSVFEKLF